MRQVHRETSFLEQVDRPLPAIRCLDHHLRAFASGAHDLEQMHRFVHDPLAEQLSPSALIA
jgi:hypothetical protein